MITRKLDRFINNESTQDFGLYSPEHIGKILEHFGAPHRDLPAIHVAGTNGKGSVAHMLNGIFSEAGYAAGLYTSPHLLAVNERIVAGNVTIADDDLSALIEEIVNYADTDASVTPTYFDVLTACALRYFHDRTVDIAIIETGLGGRLDSTNIITPLCSVITDISMDHAHILGGTLPEIAGEKAGIIKPGAPVVTSNTDPDVVKVLEEEAKAQRSPLFRLSRDFSADNVSRCGSGIRYDYTLTAGRRHVLHGVEVSHPLAKQAANSACAITACLLLGEKFPRLSDDAVRAGLRHFAAPGRYQELSADPLVIFDPAHNVAAMEEMLGLVRALHPRRRITPVLALMKDKDIPGIMRVLGKNGMTALYYELDDPRCYRPAPGAHPGLLEKVIRHDEDELARELDSRSSGDSLFFFIGSFRLYRAAADYSARHRPKCS